MAVIDFTKVREARLAEAARTKAGPCARYTAMMAALEAESLTAMEGIAQIHALRMAYQIVAHSPHWELEPGDDFLPVWSALEAVVSVLGDLIIADSYIDGSVRLTGQRYTASEVGLWAARRMILDYLLILIDDDSCPDDWLDIRDKQPLRNVFRYLGYSPE
ncbi:hypothetical protein SAMN05216582_11842 [Selenomonas ruminantium]|uniref:Uncharacterized protein n=1 Tax=Selenomonas ruminantium TaxID=971 RepID=A0A1M6VFU8_SELRU|nr:hypothetical protein [Selenomonas ruminantium]SHK80251.1 hypothetical protein SAMN05216582_11842 [Selenomonas ruminantium]